ncbi:MAG TPA: hypothetical protein VLK84_23285 [Longimicrobium sp.]|nr:hypothetical protein [Longimicrobium sp.]
MSQVTYTVGVLDGTATLVYKGTLQVQLDVGSYRSTPTAGLLSLRGFDPLLLSGGGGSGGWWSLSGDNGSLTVSSLYVYPTGQQPNQAPPYFTGSIALTAAGQQEQKLLLLGYTEGSAAPVANLLGADNAPAADMVAAAGPGVTEYAWTLALLDGSFARTGTAAFTGSGRMVQVGLSSRRWSVTGTLTGDGLPAGGIPIQGGGGEDFWYGRSEGDHPQLVFTVGTSTRIPGVSDGTLTRNNGTSFFVGIPVAQSTIPVPHLAAAAAEPA